VIIEKDIYFREGRGQPVLDGRMSILESVLAIRKAASSIHSLRQRAGAKGMLGSKDCIG